MGTSNITTITGTTANIKTLYDTGNTAQNFSNLGNETVTINGDATGNIAATNLSSIGGDTSGQVTVTTAINIQGTVAQILAALNTTETLVVAASATVEITGDTSATAANLNTINGKTTGLVNTSNITTITGTTANIKTLYDAGNTAQNFSNLGNETVTINGDATGNIAATDL